MRDEAIFSRPVSSGGSFITHSSRLTRSMASRRKKRKTQTYVRDGVAVVKLQPAEAWDGSDLVRLRETISRLVLTERRRSIGVDMNSVKHIPAGFFGELFDWHERGISIWIYQPHAKIRNMLWFRQFAVKVSDGCHRLQSGGELDLPPASEDSFRGRFHHRLVNSHC